MNYCIDPMLAEQAIERFLVTNVSFHERRPSARDFPYSIYDDGRAIAEIVKQNGVVAEID